MASKFESKILGRHKRIFPPALQFCSEAAAPHCRSDCVDNPPRQLLGSGKHYRDTYSCDRVVGTSPTFSWQRAIEDSRLDQPGISLGLFAFWVVQSLFDWFAFSACLNSCDIMTLFLLAYQSTWYVLLFLRVSGMKKISLAQVNVEPRIILPGLLHSVFMLTPPRIVRRPHGVVQKRI